MELNLKGRVALVTGGGTGIGAGISDYLAEEGVQVAVNYVVDGPAVEAFASELARKHGSRAIAVYGDVSKPADAEAMIAPNRCGSWGASTSWSTTPASGPPRRCWP